MAGSGDVAERDVLRAGQLSKRLAQIRAILDAVSKDLPEDGRTAHLDASLEALASVQRRKPGVVNELLSGPQVGAWAARCLRRIKRSGTTPAWLDLAHLGSIAAAAAMRTGTSVQVRVPVRGTTLSIPTIGRASIHRHEDWSLVDCTAGPSGVLISGEEPVDWEPVRTFRAQARGVEIRAQIDGLDPYWRAFGLPIRDPLTDDELTAWVACLTEAWRMLASRHPDRLTTIAAAVQCLVPVDQSGRYGRVSATSADAPAAVALTEPTSPTRLAAALLHETQHYRLFALHDLRPLYREPGRNLLYSPWRNDPRPLSGVLHGAHAFTAVADFWLRERRTSPVTGFEYARHVSQLRIAIDIVLRSGELTPLGRALAEALHETIDRLPTDAVPTDIHRLAQDLVNEHRAQWRLRNVVPVEAEVAAVARAWQRGQPLVTDGTAGSDAIAPAEPSGYHPLTGLAMAWAENAAEIRALADDPPAFASRFPGARPEDIGLLSGDYATVRSAAVARIEADQAHDDDWALLAVAHRRLCADLSRPLLACRPEVVRAAWQRASIKPKLPFAPALSAYEAGTSTSDSMRL